MSAERARIKRLMFPLSGPRWQHEAFMPWHVVAAAVGAYHETLFEVLDPPGHKEPDA